MIIVEGPDGAGKTTLVKELFQKISQDEPIAIAHSPGPDGNTVEYTMEAFAYEVKAGNRPVIHDRLYFSELIYGKVLRGETRFNGPQQRFVHKLLKFLDVPIIWCLPGQERAWQNFSEGDDVANVGNVNNFTKIYFEYQALGDMMRDWDLNIMQYDYDLGITSYMQERIHRHLAERRQREWTTISVTSQGLRP